MDVLLTKPISTQHYSTSHIDRRSHKLDNHDDKNNEDFDGDVALIDADDIQDHDNGDDDGDDDDDDSLVPIYNHTSSITDPSTVSQDTVSTQQPCLSPVDATLHATMPMTMSMPINEKKKVITKSKSVSKICLRDFYAHIGFLFPAIYNVLDFK